MPLVLLFVQIFGHKAVACVLALRSQTQRPYFPHVSLPTLGEIRSVSFTSDFRFVQLTHFVFSGISKRERTKFKALLKIIMIKIILLVDTKRQTSEYPFSRGLIGYSSSGYPALSTGLQNTMDARASNHLSSRVLTDKINGIFCEWLFTGLVHMY